MKRGHSELPSSFSSPSSPSSHPHKRKMLADSKKRGKSPQQELSELSDVPCYTCRRRHVKCDKTLPHCAKCAKKGVQCLGYKKPLRWAEGVAIRGKLKGKAQPVVDSQAVSIARENFKQSQFSVQEEAEHMGLHTINDSSSDPASNIKYFQELIDYHNTIICAEQVRPEHWPKVFQQVAPLSSEILHKLPQDILNCILGISAVHMAVRNPGNRSIERMALETKVRLFQGINKLFRNPQEQRPDILLSCISLLFSMDVIEHGISRWQVHFAGALKLLKSIGEPEDFASHYPHLKFSLAQTFYSKTMCVLFSSHAITDSRQATRKGIESVCFDPEVKQAFFIACPQRLMLDIYDLKECALNISRAHGSLSLADVYKREWILADVLQFEPESATRSIQEDYFSDRSLTSQEENAWELVFSSWRCAIILVVLRHLYFGVRNPDPPSHKSRSSSPLFDDLGNTQTPKIEKPFDFDQGSNPLSVEFAPFAEAQDSYTESGHLSPDRFLPDPISRSPSPLYAALSLTKPITLDSWSRRYEIHNKAFLELSSNLLNLSGNANSSYLRYVLTPLTILAFLSRPDSHERDLCHTIISQFQKFISELASLGPPNPIGGTPLEFKLPWDKLDAFSKDVENELGGTTENQLYGSAREWNWGHMLKTVEPETLWPLATGTVHMELGTDFWAFGSMINLINPKCLAALAQNPSSPIASSST